MAKKENSLIKISNQAARAKHKTFTLVEHKILVAVLEKIKQEIILSKKPEEVGNEFSDYIYKFCSDNPLLTIEMKAPELRRLLGNVNRQHTKYYLDTALGLQQKAWFDYVSEYDGKPVIGRMVLFPDIKVATDGSFIVFKIYSNVFREWFDVDKSFTLIDIKEAVAFSSNYSFLLYLDLKSRLNKSGKGEVSFSTKSLKELYGLSEEDYTYVDRATGLRRFDRPQFEKRALNKSIEEINTKTNMTIKCQKLRDGNKVTGYKMTFTYPPRHRISYRELPELATSNN